jgi:hypothetical protein
LADELPPAEIVTLDSVICCYPYLEPLLAAATMSRPRLVGITYPRDVWWMRAYMRLFNFAHAVRRSPARYFIHRHVQVERWMAGAGYKSVHQGGTREWRVVLYRRSAVGRGPGLAAGRGDDRAVLDWVIGLADEPTEVDDLRPRNRVVVMAGYILGFGQLQLPILSEGQSLTWFVAARILFDPRSAMARASCVRR